MGNKDRRRCQRNRPEKLLLGMVQIDTINDQPASNLSSSPLRGGLLSTFYVNVLNIADKGALIESSYDLQGVSQLVFHALLLAKTGW